MRYLTAALLYVVTLSASADIYSRLNSALSNIGDAPRLAALTRPSYRQSTDHSLDLHALIQRAAGRTGISPNLIVAVMAVESRFDPCALSRAGAQGLMQLMPKTAASHAVKDAYDPVANVMGGSTLLATLLKRNPGDYAAVAAAYNGGPGVLARPWRNWRQETRQYVFKVASTYGRLQREGWQSLAPSRIDHTSRTLCAR